MNDQQLRNGLKKVYKVLDVMRKAKDDDGATFIYELNNIPKDDIRKLYDNIDTEGQKVKLIRSKIIKKLLIGNITLAEIETIKEDEKEKYEKNILKARKNFSILYSLYYSFHKEEIKIFFKEFVETVIENLELAQASDYTIVDFDGAQNFWLDNFRIAIYNNSYPSQKNAKQLMIESRSMKEGEEASTWSDTINIGIWYWTEYTGTQVNDRTEISIDTITYEQITNILSKHENEIINDIYVNKTDREEKTNTHYRMYSPGELAKNWEEFLQEWIMGIWWDLGDQSKLKTRDEIKKKYIQVNGKEQNNNILACYQFSHELKPWDIIIVKKWRETLLW